MELALLRKSLTRSKETLPNQCVKKTVVSNFVVTINNKPCTMRGIDQNTMWSCSRSISKIAMDEKTLEAARSCFMTTVFQNVNTPMSSQNYGATHISGVSSKHSQNGYDEAARHDEQQIMGLSQIHSLEIVVQQVKNLSFTNPFEFLIPCLGDLHVCFVFPTKELDHPEHIHSYW